MFPFVLKKQQFFSKSTNWTLIVFGFEKKKICFLRCSDQFLPEAEFNYSDLQNGIIEQRRVESRIFHKSTNLFWSSMLGSALKSPGTRHSVLNSKFWIACEVITKQPWRIKRLSRFLLIQDNYPTPQYSTRLQMTNSTSLPVLNKALSQVGRRRKKRLIHLTLTDW